MIEVNKSTVIDEKMIKEIQITEENGMQYAIAAIARQIMKIVIWKVKELDMEWSDFLDTLFGVRRKMIIMKVHMKFYS